MEKKSLVKDLNEDDVKKVQMFGGTISKQSDSITKLKNAVPALKELFNIHEKVGEGTFSSVYLATLKTSDGTKKFALKHLVPTCHLERVERELQCLKQIGGVDHVAGLELCLRNLGSVVFVMPYIKHDKFADYVQDMSVEETKDYMRALLTAINRVHKFNIIHRDIKPSNFLYDRVNKRYLLVDFGLAQQYNHINTNNHEAKQKQLIIQFNNKQKQIDENIYSYTTKNVPECFCFGKPKICSMCLTKPPQNASRAGTPGFRAPEVLLKYVLQTPAIDIWASGVIMLCILSGTQPFFRSPDDCTALVEITTLFGSVKMQQCAKKLGKKLIFSDEIPGIDIIQLCQKLQKRNNRVNKTVIQYSKEAYHLLLKLLDLDHKTRISAEQALSHPFLTL